MKIVDVNILLYVTNERADQHASIKAWWELALRGNEPIGLAWIAIIGFVRIATSARTFPQPLSLEKAAEKIERWTDHPNVHLVQETTQHKKLFIEMLRAVGMSGKLTTDIHLAALAS